MIINKNDEENSVLILYYGHLVFEKKQFRDMLVTKSKASKKLKLDKEKIREYWQYLDPGHPGAKKQANVVGLYGDDCKYNNVGEKLIVIAMNVILFESESH